MNIIKVPLPDVPASRRSAKALEISHWLQSDHGLTREKDYDWFFMSAAQEVHFRFYDDNEAAASFLLMKWA
jgi:hypothetical protein